MLTYLQVYAPLTPVYGHVAELARLLIFIVPPIIGLGCLYSPMMGRREVLKISWLMLMVSQPLAPWIKLTIRQRYIPLHGTM
jgi:hypothetical protein